MAAVLAELGEMLLPEAVEGVEGAMGMEASEGSMFSGVTDTLGSIWDGTTDVLGSAYTFVTENWELVSYGVGIGGFVWGYVYAKDKMPKNTKWYQWFSGNVSEQQRFDEFNRWMDNDFHRDDEQHIGMNWDRILNDEEVGKAFKKWLDKEGVRHQLEQSTTTGGELSHDAWRVIRLFNTSKHNSDDGTAWDWHRKEKAREWAARNSAWLSKHRWLQSYYNWTDKSGDKANDEYAPLAIWDMSDEELDANPQAKRFLIENFKAGQTPDSVYTWLNHHPKMANNQQIYHAIKSQRLMYHSPYHPETKHHIAGHLYHRNSSGEYFYNPGYDYHRSNGIWTDD